MAEYIDRQAAIDAIDESLKRVFVLPVGKSIMDKIPAADVRPVVKSKWVKMKFFPDWECEKCGSVISGNTPDPWNHYHYCPNCGADMREEHT